MHLNSISLFHQFAAKHFTRDSAVLELGPDFGCAPITPVYKLWHTTSPFPDDRLTFTCGEYTIPVPANTYDIVFSANVIEHVRKPWVWLRELVRVCTLGGYVITICPANWPRHEDPIDCWRIYPDGMKALYEDVGLEIEAVAGRVSDGHDPAEREWFPEGVLSIDTIGVGRKV